jgi:hypothetical protein
MTMAARRKKMPNGGAESARAFAAVVDDMRGHFKALGERLQALDDKVTAGFALLDNRLTRVEDRLARVEDRLDGVEAQVADVSVELGLVKTAVLEHSRMLKGKVDRDAVEAIVEQVAARRG